MDDKKKTKVQLFFELKKPESEMMTRFGSFFTLERNIFVFSLLVVLLIWIVDGSIGHIFFYNLSFSESLFTKVPIHEIYMRLFVVTSFLVFSFIISRVLVKRKKSEEKLERESRMRTALLDNIPGCIALILKKDTREIVASNKYARELGAVPGQTCLKTCAKRDDECLFCRAPSCGKPVSSKGTKSWYWELGTKEYGHRSQRIYTFIICLISPSVNKSKNH